MKGHIIAAQNEPDIMTILAIDEWNWREFPIGSEVVILDARDSRLKLPTVAEVRGIFKGEDHGA